MLRNDAPDYNELWDEYELNRQAELDKLPRCNECGEPIQTEECYEFDGYVYCLDCMESHKMWTDDYVQ